jgi:glycyl-tRNA synthetase beta chain
LADQAERAARLAKADLVTGMVGEFPELQGLMGGYYAAAQGEAPAVAEAIRDHYKPVGQGDEVPTAPVTVAVSLADKLDTIASFFFIHELPSGSRDPFAIRRSAIAILRLVTRNNLRLSLRLAFEQALGAVSALVKPRVESGAIDIDPIDYAAASKRSGVNLRTIFDLHDAFMLERFEGLVDFPVGITRAAVNWENGWRDPGSATDFVRLELVLKSLESFLNTEDGANLLAGYKRAANILKKEGYETPSPLVGEGRGPLASASGKGEGDSEGSPTPPHPSAPSALPPSPTRGEGLSYTPEPAEAALIAALDAAGPAAADAVGNEDFEAAMAALATLRAPIDTFFDAVTVNDADPAKRAARLALLARIRDAVHRVADFSKIEG